MNQGLFINDESKIGNEILAYLVDHPKAQDTLKGIVEWWLLERKIMYETARVKEALSDLVARGLIIEQSTKSSKIFYRVNHSRLGEIKKTVNLMGR